MSLITHYNQVMVMSRKYDSKRRKKWARRILLAETIKRITLTCVRKNEDEVWMNAHDIFADWMGNPGKSRKRRRVGSRSTRYDMTTQEIMNRLRPILASDFMETRFTDTTSTIGLTTRRYRIISFRVRDMSLLDKYIEYCEAERAKI